MFDRTHLDHLKNIKMSKQGPVGRNIRQWSKNLRLDYPNGRPLVEPVFLNQLPDHLMSRTELRDFCSHNGVEVSFLAVSAWGGMNLRHATLAWNRKDEWRGCLGNLKRSNESRLSDYGKVQKVRNANNLPGVGIPYFTKLLYFLRPKADAYIMDQWTATSINLLTGRRIVDVNKYGWVTDKNEPHVYEIFCKTIDELALLLHCDSDSAESALMSYGGRNPGPWRAYVKEQRII